VSEAILHKFELAAGVEQMGGNRMPEAVAGVPAIKTGAVAVAREERLDLALPQRSMLPRKERRLGSGRMSA